ncbi:MAG TPA: cell envelope integrity protein CreD [Pseudosphingobacterium sp.]|nr:cell envelope integrity protein CreD [Pseudosphingobacterium sp.]
MENQQEKSGLLDWVRYSIGAKVVTVAFLSILLLIPSFLVIDLIHERQGRQAEVRKEIAQSWAGNQYVGGPVIVIPYKTWQEDRDSKGNISTKEIIQYVFLLPDELNVAARTQPKILHRGIFDAVVYHAAVKVKGSFAELDIKKAGVDPHFLQWEKAQLIIGVSDVKGLQKTPTLILSDTTQEMESDFSALNVFDNSLSVNIDLSKHKSTRKTFSFALNLRGSEGLFFMPLGKNTRIAIQGNWANPSFAGAYLPEKRTIDNSTFHAIWDVPHFNRPYPQQWLSVDGAKIKQSASNYYCGSNFLLPVDQYQKTMRSAKYAMLIIMLTFVSLLFTELITKRDINIIQYVLIGGAMVVYYSLMLSFSEQVGFNWAYLIASAATIVLVGLFIFSILRNKKVATLLAGILAIFYLFIYVIIQLQELSLLIGSVGLFITVALLMYTSSKVHWEKRLKT